MPRSIQPSAASHLLISARLVLLSAAAFVVLSAALLASARSALPGRGACLAVLSLAQALCLYRLYVVAHEAVHRKLFPRTPWLNDLAGVLMLAPIGAPLAIYRKVHAFHHGSNRKDSHHAALDHFKVGARVSTAARVYYRAVWAFYVFAGGFFLHSLVTILLFLLLPTSLAVRIDPVFARWSPGARLRAWAQMSLAVALHGGIAVGFGGRAWLTVLGAPLLVFAWLWSLLLYAYHYRTSVGPSVRFNVRSLPRQPALSWLLLNFNEHATHHADPSIPWYQLPERRVQLPEGFRDNDNVANVWQAIWQQRRGPILCERRAPEAGP
jgi:fatty acid desaturase